ncbi:molecular chaperone DnaJ [Nonomuraea sp. NBC_01738]|uniref:molecular chaperone DnaJ n=1 Tax=Nonomuraea sp. NBC_01738 TaxID=2976003 RepID=UPI002E138453|nr:molecular chaperone DnaJ [Nonomuraea sp. NBC_01738]
MTPAEAAATVQAARSAAELFAGESPVRVFRRLARLLHPDSSPGNTDAFTRLSALWERFNQGQTVAGYQIGPMLHRGGTAALYPCLSHDALLKVTRNPADNHLLRHEAETLTRIATDADPRFLPYFPRLLTKFRHQSGSAVRQAAVISRAPAGFVPLDRVGPGRDPRDLAWIWRRLLVATGTAHRAGITHSSLVPRHVLIHPLDHGLILVDWTRSGTRDARADIHDLTTCVAGLTGPCPPAMAAFLRGCAVRPPEDAWALLGELDELLHTLYGPRTYRPLHL